MNRYLGIFLLCLSMMVLLVVGCRKQEAQSTTMDIKTEECSGVITVDETKLRYVIEGTGVPCLVTGYASFNAPTFSKELRSHIKFIFSDFRNAYASVTPVKVENITLDTLVDDIENIRKALGFDKIAVLGHSANGWIALEYAKKYPQHTSHVIMIGAPLYYWGDSKYRKESKEFWESEASDERKMILKENWEKLPKEVLNSVSPGKAFILSYVANGPRYWYDPTYDASWLWEGLELNMDMWNHVYGVVLKDYDVIESIRQIKSPIFVAIGRYDFFAYFPWDSKKNELQGISYNLFEKSAHFPELEEQALFDKKLIDWIKGH